MALPLLQETIWFDKWKFDDAERQFYERLAQNNSGGQQDTSESLVVSAPVDEAAKSTLVDEIAMARRHIQNSLQTPSESGIGAAGDPNIHDVSKRILATEEENKELKKAVLSLQNLLIQLKNRVSALEKHSFSSHIISGPLESQQHAKEEKIHGEEDDIGGFSDEEGEGINKLLQKRFKTYKEKKCKKPAVICKLFLVLDINPWDDETDMTEMEKCVRSIQKDGLLWKTSQLLPQGNRIKKLQISCTVEEDKVSYDFLEEEITAFEDFVQSVDIVDYNRKYFVI